MNIVYDTFSGKVEKFVSKLPEEFKIRHISQYDGDSLYYLVTSTIGFGEMLKTTSDFLEKNSKKCLGVSSSGNRVWGRNYGKAADIISEKYNVPIISKFELDGKDEDIELFINKILEIESEKNESR